ncbi:hypothetical protein [Sphingobacterium hotanense]|uniref:hypothetical protein n=1 Tax=Sphingobacterium hotanense TaxID=649196 RepID=UPI0021A6C9BD|nr:hypothetical protein [Sphingobacterium hotanense]MCT1524389.1 hypothetical protein [Sphingobacterium hotanense]
MVKKHLLEKLSDNELLLFLQPQSRKVSDAIKYAKEILIERGHKFSESESKRIDDLINTKLLAENDYPEEVPVLGLDRWLPKEDINHTESKTSYNLYSDKTIALFTLIFGVFFGSVLQILNFIRVGKVGFAMITLFYCILFLLLVNQYQEIVFDLFKKLEMKPSLSAHMLIGLIGYAGLHSITQIGYPKDSVYGTKGFIAPMLISMIAILLYAAIHAIDPELTRHLGLDFLLGKTYN